MGCPSQQRPAAERLSWTPLSELALPPRVGVTGPREPGGIGFSVMRGGGIVGEHSVVFAAEDEIVTLSHSARDRALFAKGALLAAMWVRGKAPGLYGMAEVLGFGSFQRDPAETARDQPTRR